MKNTRRTKEQLLAEIQMLRSEIERYEAAEIEHNAVGGIATDITDRGSSSSLEIRKLIGSLEPISTGPKSQLPGSTRMIWAEAIEGTTIATTTRTAPSKMLLRVMTRYSLLAESLGDRGFPLGIKLFREQSPI